MVTDRAGLAPTLLAIVELGGYPNLTPVYRELGLDFELVSSQRKAQAALKRRVPDIVVAEYNFQSDFRDRTSNLETLMAILQRHPGVRVICFYLPEFKAEPYVEVGIVAEPRPELAQPGSVPLRLPADRTLDCRVDEDAVHLVMARRPL